MHQALIHPMHPKNHGSDSCAKNHRNILSIGNIKMIYSL
jgi:hypothetical protein